MAANPQLRTGREAFERRAWRAAYDALIEADGRTPLGPPDLWRLALSAHLIGRDAEFLSHLERAHDEYLAGGDYAAASRCAFWLGFRLISRGDVGPASGWLARAARLLDRVDGDRVERGYLLLPVGYRHLLTGDGDAAFETAADAVDIGERHGDLDLLSFALHLQGHARLSQARLEEGLTLLDEAMVDVASQKLSPHVAGLIYCSVIGACRRVYALRRAHDWTEALRTWCDAQPDLVAFNGECVAYRAELMNLHGDWQRAIEEALLVCDRADGAFEPAAGAAAAYQLGDAYRLLSALELAEDAYREASRLGREPQPGLALLRLAQGRPDAAAASLRRALGETADPLSRARMLPALCEILIAAGEIEESARACDELAEIAERFPADALQTMVAHARGAIALAGDDPASALVELRAALRGWQALDAPYEVARVRGLIARACTLLGDDDGAKLELDSARSLCESLGAAPAAAGLDDLVATGSQVGAAGERTPPTRQPHGLTPREAEVLAVVATGRSNRATASVLGISEKTVARHLSNIFGKLGVSSRAAATAWAYRHDLIEPSA